MRVCISCEISKIEKVRSKMKNDTIITIPLSESGLMPPTHWFCTMIVDSEKAKRMVDMAEYSKIEISEPDDFLKKWNLKIII